MPRTAELAAELKRVIRKATRDPDALAGTIPVLASFHLVAAAAVGDDSEVVQLVLQDVIPEYLRRLPENNADCLAVHELFAWEDGDGNPRTLQARYGAALAHVKGAAHDFGRRQEPRLLKVCARHFLRFDHQDRGGGPQSGTSLAPEAAPALPDAAASPLSSELLQREYDRHESRLAGLADGVFTVVNQEEMLDVLAMITRATRSTLIAVDHIALEQWFGNPRLTEYLNLQMDLARSGRATVERVRFISDAHLADAGERNLLRTFVQRHDEAGARLLLCPEDGAKHLGTIFFPRMGLLLVDPDVQPACLTGRLGDAGYIERSQVYLKLAEPVREAHRDFLRLKDYVATHDHDRALRERLAGLDDPPSRPLDVDPGRSAQPLATPRDA